MEETFKSYKMLAILNRVCAYDAIHSVKTSLVLYFLGHFTLFIGTQMRFCYDESVTQGIV